MLTDAGVTCVSVACVCGRSERQHEYIIPVQFRDRYDRTCYILMSSYESVSLKTFYTLLRDNEPKIYFEVETLPLEVQCVRYDQNCNLKHSIRRI